MRTVAGFLLLIGSGFAQQEAAAPQPAAGDSVDIAARTAELYERSFRELLRCLDGLEQGWVQLPIVGGVPIEEVEFDPEEWAEPVQRSAAARALFAQAAALPAPRFEEVIRAQGQPEIDDANVCWRLGQLAQLTYAHGASIRGTRPDIALGDAVTLLRHARHVKTQGRSDSISAGTHVELLGMRLAGEVVDGMARRSVDEAALQRFRDHLREHDRERASLRRIGDMLVAEAPQQVPRLRPQEPGSEPTPEDVLWRELNAAIVAILIEEIEPLRREVAPTAVEMQRRAEQFEARVRRVRQARGERTGWAVADAPCLAEDVRPPVEFFAHADEYYRQRRAAVAARIAELLDGR